MEADIKTGKRSFTWFTALSAFWPGLQTLYGDVGAATRTMLLFSDIWRRFGFVPEVLDLYKDQIHEKLVQRVLSNE